jgi:hypothetical protein
LERLNRSFFVEQEKAGFVPKRACRSIESRAAWFIFGRGMAIDIEMCNAIFHNNGDRKTPERRKARFGIACRQPAHADDPDHGKLQGEEPKHGRFE